ncbi:TonB-dependent receptor [Taibaiella helva]|uniref:TonB-dependent receptor n=1 Tax=Taibaiella helva TaxID=2301235 RepID=UPI000E57531C|nr:TonB-dependent receptor [Taibaiella helva]
MRNLFTLLLSLLVAGQVFAGGKILGTVTDGGSSETLIGVSVSLFQKGGETPMSGTITDIDGNYIFEVAPGDYEIEVQYVGYQTKRITDINVTEGNTTKASVAMSEPKNTQLDEVVIQGTVKKETVNALYTMQKNAVAVSDGISAEAIRRSPDRSTGEALKRVSGTTIQDNKFVIVRGLSDRYNTALVDDAVLPSTEPNRKAFSFDIIPSSMIDNIIITKAGTPDLPGDFAGGVINILSKEVPDDNFTNISIGTGFNTASTFKTFKSGYRTSTDFLGFDNGDRQLPKSFPSQKSIAGKNLTPEQSVSYLKMLNNDFSTKEHTALPAMNLQASLGRVFNLKGNSRFGVTAAVTYNHSENIKPELLRQYDNYDYKDNIYNYSTNLGALLNLGYYTGKSKINLKTFYNRIFDDNYLEREGVNAGSSQNVKYYAYDLIQKSLFKTTLSGDHQIGGKQGKLNWLLSYNYITNNQPDQRKVAYTQSEGTTEPFMAQLYSLGKANNRLFGSLNETVLNGGVNYAMPFKFLNKSSLKLGAFATYRHRDFANRYIGALINTQQPNYLDVLQRPLSTLFASDVVSQNYYTLADLTGDADQYKAKAMTTGGYLMLDNKITDKFRIVWGARLESYHIDLSTPEKKEVDQTWTDILPSANLTYALSEKSNLRASYFRSVARPELREMANLGYYDYELSAQITGNSGLKRSQIDNADLRYEWYPRAGEIISVSVFYKHFNNTLENFVYGDGSAYDITTKNYKSAQNIGAELEIRKKLDFIADKALLRNLSFYMNLAYINSKVNTDPYYVRTKLVDSRPLSGQSPYVVNTSLGYTSTDGKLSLNLLYNLIGQRLYLVGGGRVGNVYESPRNLLDFQASYAVSKHSEFRLNIKDLINNPVRFYFDQDSDEKFGTVGFADGKINPDKDWLLQQYKPGRSFSLTYSYKF